MSELVWMKLQRLVYPAVVVLFCFLVEGVSPHELKVEGLGPIANFLIKLTLFSVIGWVVSVGATAGQAASAGTTVSSSTGSGTGAPKTTGGEAQTGEGE